MATPIPREVQDPCQQTFLQCKSQRGPGMPIWGCGVADKYTEGRGGEEPTSAFGICCGLELRRVL